MRETLLALAGRSPAGFTDIRYHRRRGIRLERHGREAGAPIPTEDSGGLVRCTSPGAGWGIASFRDPGEAGAAVALAHELSLLAPAAAAGQLTEVPARDGEFPCPAQRDPAQVSMAAKEDLLALAAAALHDADRRIVASRLVYQDLLEDTWLVTSEGTSLAESRPRMELSALAIAEEEGTRERALDSIAVAGAWFDLEEWIGRIGHLAEKAVLLLRAVPVRPGRVPVVLDPLAAGLLAHRCAGHLCHGDRDEDQGPAPVGLRVGPP
ncbi:MAG TPA: hypothetical protein VLL51_04085, partial [Gemmatimonadales bacterium]|nr:hypothetical protein [Gemmatimonadales bacterium]